MPLSDSLFLPQRRMESPLKLDHPERQISKIFPFKTLAARIFHSGKKRRDSEESFEVDEEKSSTDFDEERASCTIATNGQESAEDCREQKATMTMRFFKNIKIKNNVQAITCCSAPATGTANCQETFSSKCFEKTVEESQFEAAYRISRYLTEVYGGSKEPHPLFVGELEPPISFLRYVERLIKLTNKWVEEADGPDSFGVRCALLAVEYLVRIDIKLCAKSIHRYFMAAYLIGIKLIYDYYISNSFWAEVSGCPREQLNLMEIHLCSSLSWDFSVNPDKHQMAMHTFVWIH